MQKNAVIRDSTCVLFGVCGTWFLFGVLGILVGVLGVLLGVLGDLFSSPFWFFVEKGVLRDLFSSDIII